MCVAGELTLEAIPSPLQNRFYSTPAQACQATNTLLTNKEIDWKDGRTIQDRAGRNFVSRRADT